MPLQQSCLCCRKLICLLCLVCPGRCIRLDSKVILNDLTRSSQAKEDCSCFVPSCPSCCLFSDMRPAKLLAAIALMRKLKITHVVEDGRYGGLSALIYALHGFHVTSIEFLPLGHVSAALGSHGNVHLVDGDSRQKVVEVIEELQTSNAAVAVIFDGLKRFEAYEVYQKIASKVSLAIFDDTNIRDGFAFRQMLHERNHSSWSTDSRTFGRVLRAEEPVLQSLLQPLRGRKFMGGMEKLGRFHYTMVEGGQWPSEGVCEAW
ncbi:unnamed protein product [Durusdinium trenchii]|uniref:Uncharacterized protein n=1 Tax=Durusdinium trenchii TaxID=1381693 RepID=A0ABP0RLB1_9DINO